MECVHFEFKLYGNASDLHVICNYVRKRIELENAIGIACSSGGIFAIARIFGMECVEMRVTAFFRSGVLMLATPF